MVSPVGLPVTFTAISPRESSQRLADDVDRPEKLLAPDGAAGVTIAFRARDRFHRDVLNAA